MTKHPSYKRLIIFSMKTLQDDFSKISKTQLKKYMLESFDISKKHSKRFINMALNSLVIQKDLIKIKEEGLYAFGGKR